MGEYGRSARSSQKVCVELSCRRVVVEVGGRVYVEALVRVGNQVGGVQVE
jgi:hypothetical protein